MPFVLSNKWAFLLMLGAATAIVVYHIAINRISQENAKAIKRIIAKTKGESSMSISEIWRTREIYLWMIDPQVSEHPTFLPCAGITEMLLPAQANRSHVILGSILPQGMALTSASNDTIFEIHRTECGRGDVYDKENAVFVLDKCEIVTKEIEHLWPDEAYEDEVLSIALEIECDVQVLKGEMFNV